jgi:hypothetical protein
MKEDILDRVRIATPCSVSWESMNGNEKARFCSQCKLQVYDISKLTRREAVSLITSSEGRICGRLYRRADGTLLTRDCPVGLRALRRRVARVAGATLAAVLGLLSPVVAQKHKSDKDSCKNIPAIQIVTRKSQGQAVTIKGKVQDANGAELSGARIRLVNQITKEEIAVVSTKQGEFVIANVSGGKYALEFSAPAFLTEVLTDLEIANDDELLITATLPAGEYLTGVVEVSLDEPIMSPPGTMIINGDMIRRLPH